eukprot:710033-Prymnesium_polylepis.1
MAPPPSFRPLHVVPKGLECSQRSRRRCGVAVCAGVGWSYSVLMMKFLRVSLPICTTTAAVGSLMFMVEGGFVSSTRSRRWE